MRIVELSLAVEWSPEIAILASLLIVLPTFNSMVAAHFNLKPKHQINGCLEKLRIPNSGAGVRNNS
jgi:hypothetical protein